MRLRIRSRLFVYSFGLIVLSLAVAYAAARTKLERLMLDGIQRDLEVRTRLVASQVSAAAKLGHDSAAWDSLADRLGLDAQARVTLIHEDGRVFGDSELPSTQISGLEDHRRRPEVASALQGKFGQNARYSTTLGRRLLYSAAPLVDQGRVVGVARTAVPLTQIDQAIGELNRSLAFGGMLALAVALVLSFAIAEFASRAARNLVHAANLMARGKLETRTQASRSDELGDLGRALDKLAGHLSVTLGELRLERDRLSGILTGMQEGVLLLDQGGRISLVNPALREMLLLEADAEGRTPGDVIRYGEIQQLLDTVQKSQEPVSEEVEISGLKPRRLLVRAAPLTGQARGAFAVVVDVTEMRRLESMRRDFVANVSHELRTPVTAIRSAAETLQLALEGHDTAAAVRFVEIIDRNAQRLRELVEDVLDLARIEARELRLNPEQLSLGPVFNHILGLFAERAVKKGLTLESALQDELAAFADGRALEQVLTNLVDNAIKYCPSNSRVALAARQEGRWVRITVTDNGPGIESKHLARLFERFYRVNAGRSRELGGTGLGLAIVKHLVESMGGQVRVESTPGKGTTFSFELPARAPADSVPVSPLPGGPETPTRNQAP